MKYFFFVYAVLSFCLSASGQNLVRAESGPGMAETSPSVAADVLRYGEVDLRTLANDPSHPLAKFVSERLTRRLPMPCVWAEVANQYMEQGLYEHAWGIHHAMLGKAIRGEERLPPSAFELIVRGLVVFPTHFKGWDDIEEELFALFKGRQTNERACGVLKDFATALNKTGQVEKAISFARRFVSTYPDDAIGTEALHLIPSSALVYLEIASRHRGTKVGATALLKFAETRVRQGEPDGAVTAYKQLLRLYPGRPEVPRVLQRLARLLTDAGEREAALVYLEELREHVAGADAVEVAVRIAETHRRLGNWDQYLGTYRSIAEQCTKWAPLEAVQAVLAGADQAYREDRIPEAAELYELHVRLLCQVKGMSLEHLPTAKAIDQERVSFWRGCLKILDGREDEPSPRVADRCDRLPSTREAAFGHYVLARRTAAQGQWQESLQHAEALLTLAPGSRAAEQLAGEARARVTAFGTQDQRADEGFKGVIEPAIEEAKDPESAYEFAQNAMRTGRDSQAIRSLEALAATWPESSVAPRALFDAAMIHADRLGNREKMRDSLERLMVLYPETELGVTAFGMLNREGVTQE